MAYKDKEKQKETQRKYHLKNKENILKQHKEYWILNKEKIKESNRKYRVNNKEILAKKQKEYYLKNKERIAKQEKEYYLKNKERIKAYQLKNREKRKKTHKDWLLRTKYGLTLADYNKMIKEQGGVCYICQNPPNVKALAVDHCHTTGKVRRLLCDNCNKGLGCFKDSPELLQKAINYLKKETHDH
jgi:DNA gyrase/topoisomerase IV subunit A